MSRSGATGTHSWHLDDEGIYEVGGTKHDNHKFLIHNKEGQWQKITINDERARKIAKLMDSGVSFEEARLKTRIAVAKPST